MCDIIRPRPYPAQWWPPDTDARARCGADLRASANKSRGVSLIQQHSRSRWRALPPSHVRAKANTMGMHRSIGCGYAACRRESLEIVPLVALRSSGRFEPEFLCALLRRRWARPFAQVIVASMGAGSVASVPVGFSKSHFSSWTGEALPRTHPTLAATPWKPLPTETARSRETSRTSVQRKKK